MIRNLELHLRETWTSNEVTSEVLLRLGTTPTGSAQPHWALSVGHYPLVLLDTTRWLHHLYEVCRG